MVSAHLYLSKNDKSKNANDIKVSSQYVQSLKQFQIDGIRFLHKQYTQYKTVKGAILNDEKSLGKTVQIILYLSALQLVESTKTLIICNEQLFDHWLYHIATWSKSTVSLLTNDTSENKDFKIACLYDASEILKHDWGIVVIDDLEPNDVTKQLGKIRCKFKIWLRNQNLLDDIKKLHCILNWITPGSVGTYKQFDNRFSIHNLNISEIWAKKQTLDFFCKTWLLRRSRKMVADDLPLIHPSVHKKMYKEWEKECDRIKYERNTMDSMASDNSDRAFCSDGDNVEFVEQEPPEILKVNNSESEEIRSLSPSLLNPLSCSVTNKINTLDENIKRKGTKDITGLKIKQSKRRKQDIIETAAQFSTVNNISNDNNETILKPPSDGESMTCTENIESVKFGILENLFSN